MAFGPRASPMNTIPIRYVGKTPTNIDPILSLSWKKGEIKDIPRDSAPFLLFYTESFQDARAKGARKADPVEPRERRLSDIVVKNQPVYADISRMDDKGVEHFAMANFRMERRDTPIDVFRNQVFSRMRREAA